MSTEENIVKLNSLHYSLPVDDENMERELLKPFSHHISTPSTGFRENLIKALMGWITVPEDKLAKIHAILHYTYNGVLMLDDIQDKSILRRGIPTAHTVYGIPRVLITVDWIFSIMYGLLDELNDKELTQMAIKEMVNVFAGQGMELYWRENSICPTEAEYLQMVYRKTSLALILVARSMNAFSIGKQVDTEKLLTVAGLYGQILDDYNNLCNEHYFDNKGFCDDLSEGKFGFPIIHAINNFPEEGTIIKNILAKHTYDVKEKKYCISIIEKCGSFKYTRNKLQKFRDIIYEEAGKLDPNPAFVHFIEKPSQKLKHRQSEGRVILPCFNTIEFVDRIIDDF